MEQQGFRDLKSDGPHRIETGHRLLKDHRDVVSANLTQGFFGQRREIGP
jgi:hypothetical protein